MTSSECNTALSRDEVLRVIKSDLGRGDFDLIDYSLSPASVAPMGFMGVHIRLQATVEAGDKNIEMKYFTKKIPTDIPTHHAYARDTGAFFKEIQFYEAVVHDIKRNMTPGRAIKKWCPEHYYSRGSDIFVIEDLGAKGYYMYPERTVLELENVLATVEAMAIMHAGSLILEEKLNNGTALAPPKNWKSGERAYHADLYPGINFETEATGEPGHFGNTFHEAGIKSQLAIVDLLPNYTLSQKENIKKRLPDILRRMFYLVKPSDKYRNVWVHGDLWSNNIMFHNGPDGKVDDAILIDFQLARLAPPAHDLIMFIHLVQSREFREKHLPSICERYFAVLKDEVEAEGLDIELVLSYTEFIESCNHYYEYALICQVLYYQLILSPPSITSKFLASPELFDLNMLVDRSEMVTETYKTDEQCRNRITEGMDELITFHNLADD